jgi:hypothetical protein
MLWLTPFATPAPRVQKGSPAPYHALVTIGALAFDLLGIITQGNIAGSSEQTQPRLADTQARKFRHDFGGHVRRGDLRRKLVDQFC